MKKENQYFIVRADRAGVFFGNIVSKTDTTVTMSNVRKLHYWAGAAAVEQLALDGTLKPSECRFTMVVPEMDIANWVQIIPCTDKAVTSLMSVKEWKI